MKNKKEIEVNYDFGEKEKEKSGKSDAFIPVNQTPKYKQSKRKAIELIESGLYGLDEGDFWILKNEGFGKMQYSGLIISHNGCLKINDKLDEKMKFKPSSVSFLRDDGANKVMQYVNEEQGIYEFGEISSLTCKNQYHYAMVLKRLFDRVVLKTSKIGFYGIYSENESEDFANKEELKADKKEIATIEQEQGIKIEQLCKQKGLDISIINEAYKINSIIDLPINKFNQVIAGLNKKPDAQQIKDNNDNS